MPQYIQGQEAEDYFSVIDASGNFVIGEAWTVTVAIDPDDESFTLGVEEVGNGVYRTYFNADKVGAYYYRIDSTTLVPPQSFEELITIIPPEIHGSTVGPAAYGNTLDDLFRAVATEVGDFLELIATSNGAAGGGSFPDAKRLASIPPGSLSGAAIYIQGPPLSENLGLETRVSDSSGSATEISLDPAFPNDVAEGDIGWVTNLNARGYWRVQIVSAINNAIRKASGHRVPVEYDDGDPFDAASGRFDRPTNLVTLYEVQAVDADGVRYTIPFNDSNSQSDAGWWYDYAAHQVVIGEYWRERIDGYTMRLLGTGRPSTLINPDDYTTIDFDWLVNTAAATLKRGKDDQRQLAPASMMDNRADQAYLATLTMWHPNEIKLV